MYSISVIIPIYNRHDTIKEALRSVYEQNWPSSLLEVILSDDFSDQPYNYLLEEFPQLKIIRSNVNKGAGVARQKGLNIATGDWICFLDADDRLAPNFFNILNEVDSQYYIIRTQVQNLLLNEKHPPIILSPEELGYVHGTLFRNSFLRNNDIKFHPYLRIYEDKYFQKIATYCCPENNIYKKKQIGYFLQQNEKSVTFNFGQKWHAEIIWWAISEIDFFKFIDNRIDRKTKIHLVEFSLSCVFESCDLNIFYLYFTYIKEYLNIDNWEDMKNTFQFSESDMMKLEKIYNRWINKKNYDLSIIIPLYNSHKYIQKTLDNLYKNLDNYVTKTQIILTDDASQNPDYSYLLDKYKNLTIINNDTNLGMGGNRNRGLEIADGKWICFLDHDDEGWTKEAFKTFFSCDKSKYSVIQGRVGMENGQEIISITTLTLLHGKFYKKSFLDNCRIRFSNHILTAEDFCFGQQVLLALYTKRKGLKSVLSLEDTFYIWSFNKNSYCRQLYNHREYNEEFFHEHIFASLLAIQNDNVNQDMKKVIICYAINDACCAIDGYRGSSLNFKKSNIKYICGLLLFLKERFNIDRDGFNNWYKETCIIAGEIYSTFDKWLSFTNRRGEQYIDIAYNILERMSKEQLLQLENEFKNAGIYIHYIEDLDPRLDSFN